MSDFQARLWSELVRDHAPALAYPVAAGERRGPLAIAEPRPTVPRRRSTALRGRLAAALAALAVAVAVVTITTTTGTAPSAAYAVTRSADGTVHVSISDLTGVSGANAQLEELGVPVRVVPVLAACREAGDIITPTPLIGLAVAHAEAGIAIRPALIPAGETLVLTARQVEAAVYLSYAFYRGPIPSCVAEARNAG